MTLMFVSCCAKPEYAQEVTHGHSRPTRNFCATSEKIALVVDNILIVLAFALSAYLRHKGIQGFEMLGPAATCLLLINIGCVFPCKIVCQLEHLRGEIAQSEERQHILDDRLLNH